jgi:hypothetical protein
LISGALIRFTIADAIGELLALWPGRVPEGTLKSVDVLLRMSPGNIAPGSDGADSYVDAALAGRVEG